MTRLLEQALTEVHKLPEPEQDAIAALILDELADERRWQESFARSQDQLARLAQKAREDVAAGRVVSGGFDQL
jgi:aspartate/glutamate racemase